MNILWRIVDWILRRFSAADISAKAEAVVPDMSMAQRERTITAAHNSIESVRFIGQLAEDEPIPVKRMPIAGNIGRGWVEYRVTVMVSFRADYPPEAIDLNVQARQGASLSDLQAQIDSELGRLAEDRPGWEQAAVVGNYTIVAAARGHIR